jgi:5-methylcytosine-specific restriction protein B
MNSTDKSIATIDIALRRRFTFLKMRPNLELVSDKKAKEFMQILNQYIAKKLGEDYMLGHSYFMGDIDLDFVKEYKIKPLLEEYFYADEKSPDKIISAAFNEVKKENKVEEDNE